jgi:hypothetical protein
MTHATAPADLEQRLAGMLVEDTTRHVYKLHRAAFTDEELFDLEMQHIFEGNWIYLAHESQIPNVNDYLTTQIGRQPIVITRNKAGELNASRPAEASGQHRGAAVPAWETSRLNSEAGMSLSTDTAGPFDVRTEDLKQIDAGHAVDPRLPGVLRHLRCAQVLCSSDSRRLC